MPLLQLLTNKEDQNEAQNLNGMIWEIHSVVCSYSTWNFLSSYILFQIIPLYPRALIPPEPYCFGERQRWVSRERTRFLCLRNSYVFIFQVLLAQLLRIYQNWVFRLSLFSSQKIQPNYRYLSETVSVRLIRLRLVSNAIRKGEKTPREISMYGVGAFAGLGYVNLLKARATKDLVRFIPSPPSYCRS